VKAPVAAGDFAFEQFSVKDVAGHTLELHALQAAHVAFRSQQSFHRVPARDEFVDKVCADEARRARDKTVHGLQKIRFNSGGTPAHIPINFLRGA